MRSDSDYIAAQVDRKIAMLKWKKLVVVVVIIMLVGNNE
jgi:hypothetical protein